MTATLTVDLDSYTGTDAYGGTPAALTLYPMTTPYAAGGKVHVGVVQIVLDAEGQGSTPLIAGVVYRTVLDGATLYIGPLTDGTTVDLSDPAIISNTPPNLPSGGGGNLIPVSTNTTTPAGTLGALVGYLAQAAVTINGEATASGDWIVFAWDGTAWVTVATGTLGATDPTPTDTTPPTAGALSVSTTSTEANLSVAGALDDVALHATPYSFSKDAGATWTAWQAATTYKFTGLASSTSFTFQHKVRDAAGNVKIGTSVAASTPYAPTWVVLSRHDFEGVADNTLLNGLTPIVGTALNVQSTKDPSSTGTASTAAKVIGGAATTTAASGWTPDYSLYWSGLSGVRGVRATITYDFTGGASNNPPQVFLRLPLNSEMTNHITFGAEFGMTTPHVVRYGGSAHTSVVEATAPTFTNTGKVTVEATWAADGTGGIVKVFYNDELHTTYTLTGSTIFPDEMGIGHQTGAVGPASTKMLDYRLETTT